ncbi:2'-5' RNA ligase family protein [Echinicola shivajiensis]|uniref:2'-5' RNA ligase family protein n=1 Tax=Echinicola shivajiensis TaxID=1035916 RepID=UPI001BFC9B63|nr:2'-5' RNA ligase family protein [Echinicola shivajiensis]
MAKSIQKYFLAIVPSEGIQEDAVLIKEEVKEMYNAKHALKSPAHVTLKMPFVWNERKEDKLEFLLSSFFERYKPFAITFKGIGRFGKRIMYARVSHGPELSVLQEELKLYCRKELKLNEELSDKAYTPHMTLVYSDLKDRFFDECWKWIKEKGFYGEMKVDKIALLKKKDYRWSVLKEFELGGKVAGP